MTQDEQMWNRHVEERTTPFNDNADWSQTSFLNAYSVPFPCLFQFIEAKSYSKASPMRKSTGPLKPITLGSNNTFNHASFTSQWRNFGLVLFPIFNLPVVSHTGGLQAWAAFFRPCHSISSDHSHLQQSHLNFFPPQQYFSTCVRSSPIHGQTGFSTAGMISSAH